MYPKDFSTLVDVWNIQLISLGFLYADLFAEGLNGQKIYEKKDLYSNGWRCQRKDKISMEELEPKTDKNSTKRHCEQLNLQISFVRKI